MYFTNWYKSFGLKDSKEYKDYYDAYRSTVYSCVTLRSQAVAKAKHILYAVVKGNDVEVKRTHPFYKLIARPNRFRQTWYDLRVQRETYLDLVGNAYWYVMRDKLGVPTEFIPILPENMSVVPAQDGSVAYYQYTYSDGTVSEPLYPRDVLHFKRSPDPSDFYYGMSPLKAASYNADVDLAMSIYVKTFMENDATPRYAIFSKNRLNDKPFQDLVNRWHASYSGANKAGTPVVLDNGLDIKPVSLSVKEMDWLKSRKGNRDEIMQIFGIPPSVGNVAENVNRSSSVTGMLNFIDNTIDPLLTQETGVLQMFIQENYDERILLKYWIERPSDPEIVVKENESGIKMGYISINEARQRVGYSPVANGDEVKPFNPNPVNEPAKPTE